jgi:hypothetical protein
MCLHLRIARAAVPQCGARFELRTGAGSASSVRSKWYPLTRTGEACSTRHTQTAYSLLGSTWGTMNWDFAELQHRRRTIVGNIGRESVDVYRYLADEFASSDVSENLVFQFVFRSFYGIDRAGLSPRFKTAYFRCMQDARTSLEGVSLWTVANRLKRCKSLRGLESLQFSFITKLANMVNPALPIWDSKIASLLGLCANASGDYVTRFKRMSERYDILLDANAALADSGLAHGLVEDFRAIYQADEQSIPFAKALDFVLWSAGSTGCRLYRA